MFFIVSSMSGLFLHERAAGTLMRLRGLGVSARALLLSKALPYVGVNAVQAVLMGAVGILVLPWLGGEALSLSSAINKAGRQRMLTQRMGKAWAMRALGVELNLANKIRQQSEALFISQLGELQKTTPTPEIATAATALAQAWEVYRADLALTPGKDDAASVYASGDQALQRAHALTLLYEKQMDTPQGHLVNISGRQRMLSQRMARAFYFARFGIAADTAGDLAKAREEFVAGLQELVNAPQNTPVIKQELTLAEQQWIFYRASIDGQIHGARADENIATTSERILEQLNLVTAKYEAIAG
jgi:hypothetical protein